VHLALERARLFEAHRSAVRDAKEAKAEFETSVYGLAHDLKNPTIALAGLAELLPEARDQAEWDELITQIRRSAAWVYQLVEALLEISRVGRTLTETEPVDLGVVTGRVIERARQTAPAARVTVRGSLPRIEASPTRVEQLVDNLVTNAIRHGGRDDVTVTIGAEHDADEVRLTVGDDGAGIAEADRERIFELFQRGTHGFSRGSGIGLALVRRIAESYGGTVELADSETGAAFVVRLPWTRLINGTG
jgi:signal transduction histidine kinase